MTRPQIAIAIGIFAAATVLSATFLRSPLWTLAADASAAAPASPLWDVGRWFLAPVLCLAGGITAMAVQRYFSRNAIDGARNPEGHLLEINLRYNQNTLEQAALAVAAWAGLAIAAPRVSAVAIPVLAVLFVVGRAAFLIGYLIAPWARAFGFVLTFIPTLATLCWLAWRAMTA